MRAFEAVAAFVLGTIAGSFANVVVHRVPKGLSIVRPGSQCPGCGHALNWFENVPIASYILLRGRCRTCRSKISPRYLVIEALMGAAWALVTLRVGVKPELPAFLWLVSVLVVLSAIDLETRRIPNKILGPSAIASAALLVAAALISGSTSPLVTAGLGALSYGLPMLGLAIAVPAGMGMGDVKLAAYLGMHLGWFTLWHVAVGAFAGFFIGAFAGITLMAVNGKGRKQTIPFGPAMAAGAGVAIFAGAPILRLWLGI
ncbi:MAG: prepilin peptidase [Actinomycetota bacterium]